MLSRSSAIRAVTLGMSLVAAGSGCAQRSDPGPAAAAAQSAAPAVRRVVRPAFDRDNAWKLLAKQCAFGARPVGSEAHARTREYLLEAMGALADRTYSQDFRYRGMPLTNVIGLFNPAAPRQILLCAHWDTRPVADQEVDAVRAARPITGANDGASGVAVLLEIGRMLKAKKAAVGVAIVLLDGEDYGNFQRDEGVFLGSRYFARNYRSLCKPEFGILLDMVGDKDLTIYRERSSQRLAPEVNRKVFSIAAELGHDRAFINELKYEITDDHLPLNQAGIPTIDLIDFDYGPWHTLDDVASACSAASLGVVGDVVAELIYREPARL